MPAYRSTIFVAKWSAICAAEYGTINTAISVTQPSAVRGAQLCSLKCTYYVTVRRTLESSERLSI